MITGTRQDGMTNSVARSFFFLGDQCFPINALVRRACEFAFSLVLPLCQFPSRQRYQLLILGYGIARMILIEVVRKYSGKNAKTEVESARVIFERLDWVQ